MLSLQRLRVHFASIATISRKSYPINDALDGLTSLHIGTGCYPLAEGEKEVGVQGRIALSAGTCVEASNSCTVGHHLFTQGDQHIQKEQLTFVVVFVCVGVCICVGVCVHVPSANIIVCCCFRCCSYS